MNKYWKKTVNLAEIMLEIGKQKGCKDDIKLLQCVNKLKQKYNSLRQACHLADISRTKFHRLTLHDPGSVIVLYLYVMSIVLSFTSRV